MHSITSPLITATSSHSSSSSSVSSSSSSSNSNIAGNNCPESTSATIEDSIFIAERGIEELPVRIGNEHNGIGDAHANNNDTKNDNPTVSIHNRNESISISSSSNSNSSSSSSSSRMSKRCSEIANRANAVPNKNIDSFDFDKEVRELRGLYKLCGSTVGPFRPVRKVPNDSVNIAVPNISNEW